MANKKKKPTTGNKTADRALKRVGMTLTSKLILFLVLTLILGVSLFFSGPIERAFSLDARLSDVTETPDGALDVVKEGDLRVHFVDVGQGDCTIVEFPDDKTMIVDGGEKDAKDKILSYIDQTIKPAHPDFEYFDYCILTHTDSDHCGSLDDVLNEYPAQTVWRPNVIATRSEYTDPGIALTEDASSDPNVRFWAAEKGIEVTDVQTLLGTISSKSTVAYKEFLEAAYDSDRESVLPEETTVYVSDGRRGTNRPSGKSSTDILNDEAGYRVEFYAPLTDSYKDWNNYSNILTVKYNNRTIMLTGDAEKESEAEFVATYASDEYVFNVDVLKLGHHGSRTSSSEAFLRRVMNPDFSADYFVVSCGLNNSYGHPHTETLERLSGVFGVSDDHILRTDSNGTILLSIDENGAAFNGTIAVAPSYRGTVTNTPVKWWHIALGLEVLCFVAIFLIIRTKRKEGRKNK